MKYVLGLLLIAVVSAGVPSIRQASAEEGTGGKEGGGGNAVVCFNDTALAENIRQRDGEIPNTAIDKIISIEMFDLYEARLQRGIVSTPRQVVAIGPHETVAEYVERIAKRFDPAVPFVADILRFGVKGFDPDNILRQQAGLKREDDADEVSLISQGNCVLSTMARQYSQGSTNFLEIDSRLFDHPKHSELSKAILLVHEYVYLRARQLGQRNSRNTRSLVGMMIAEKTGLTVGALIARTQDLGFRGYHGEDRDYAHSMMEKAGGELVSAARQAYQEFSKTYAESLGAVFRSADYSLGHKLVTGYQRLSDGEMHADGDVVASCKAGLDRCSHYLRIALDQAFGSFGPYNNTIYYIKRDISEHSDKSVVWAAWLEFNLTSADQTAITDVLKVVEQWRDYRSTWIQKSLELQIKNWMKFILAMGAPDAVKDLLLRNLGTFVVNLSEVTLKYDLDGETDSELMGYHGASFGLLFTDIDLNYLVPDAPAMEQEK